MSRLGKLALAFLVCTSPLAIAQDNPWGPPGSSKKSTTGVVVFFREKKYIGGGAAFKVREGNVELGKLSNGTYFTVRARPGLHRYEVHSEARDVITLEVEPGETYFVSFGLSMGVVAGRPNLAPSDRQTFIKLYDKLKDVTGKDIK